MAVGFVEPLRPKKISRGTQIQRIPNTKKERKKKKNRFLAYSAWFLRESAAENGKVVILKEILFYFIQIFGKREREEIGFKVKDSQITIRFHFRARFKILKKPKFFFLKSRESVI